MDRIAEEQDFVPPEIEEEIEEGEHNLPSLSSLTSIPNIATLLSDDLLDTIGKNVVQGYEDDETSRHMWLEKYKEGMEMALQIFKDKTWPWPKASNVKFPLMSIACLQFHARAYPSLVPTAKVVAAKVLGDDHSGMKAQRAMRVETFMNYQVLDEMDSWDEDMDRLLITLPITGTEFKKTYFDSEYGCPVSEHVFAKDLVINYFTKDLDRAPRITHIIEMSRNEFEEKERAGLFLDVDEDLQPNDQTRDDPSTRLIRDREHLVEPSEDRNIPVLLLEQHTFYDLDGDGYAEPYIITVNKANSKVARIVARFQKDAIEQSKGMILKITPDQYFTKYTFVPAPDGGFYGLGFIHLVGGLNKAVNTIINQLIDAGTLSNLQSGFLSRSFRQRGGNMQFQPGEWKIANATGQDLASGIFPLPVREPSAVLFSLLGMLIEVGQRLTSTTDMMVGENPGQNQKATTTQAVMESGMKVFTAVYKRIHKALGKEFKKLYKLNSENFDKKLYAEILDVPVETLDIENDFSTKDYKVCPAADPEASSHATRLAKAQALVQLIPMGLDRIIVLKRLLAALEIENIDEFKLDQAQQQGPPPDPKIMLQAQELQLTAQKQQHDMALADHEQQRKDKETQIKAEKIGVDARVKIADSHTKLAIAAMTNHVKAATSGGTE